MAVSRHISPSTSPSPSRHHASSAKPPRHNPQPSAKRPARPALRKNHSGIKGKKKKVEVVSSHIEPPARDDDDSMAASFLNYCTYCDRQIIVPCNTILYCSENCRRRDTNKPLALLSSSAPPSSTVDLSFQKREGEVLETRPPIIPKRCPTSPDINRLSFASSASIALTSEHEPFPSGHDEANAQHHFSTTPSPLMRSTSYYTPPQFRRSDSEAARYLRQFQSSSTSLSSLRHPSVPHTERPLISRASTATSSLNTSPASSHTPSSPLTPASSRVGTDEYEHTHSSNTHSYGQNTRKQTRVLSATSGITTSTTEAAFTGHLPPSSYARPLPPRTNPRFSSSFGGERSAALLSPFSFAGGKPKATCSPSSSAAEPVASAPVQNPLPGLKSQPTLSFDVGAELLPDAVQGLGIGERREMHGACGIRSTIAGGTGKGTLRALFNYRDMQAPPSGVEG